MKYRNIYEAISDNSRKECKVSNCHNPRSRVSGYCKGHSSTKQRFGHPEHRKLLPKEYAREREECSELIEKNIETHDGIKYAINWIDAWLQAAWDEKPGVVCPDHFRRLYDAGITGKDILIECCALWLFQNRNPRRIFDIIHLTYVLGNRILRISPYWHSLTGTEHRACGEHLRKNIGVMFVTVARTIEQREYEEQMMKEKLGQPLNI